MLICILIYTYFEPEYIDMFTNKILNNNIPNTEIIFLDKEAVNNFFIEDPDNYVLNLSKPDLIARKVNTPYEYIKNIVKYSANLSDDEKIKLTSACKLADVFFINNKHYVDPIISSISWTFAKIYGDYYENGYPHTRKNIIFLNDNIISNYSLCELGKLLIHEKIHVYQRYFPEKLENYMSNFEKVKHRSFEPLIRSNPDLDEWIYAYKYNMEPLIALYNSDSPNGLADITILNSTINYEHPYEFMAYDIIKHFTCT